MTKNLVIAILSVALVVLFMTRSCNSNHASEKGFSLENSTDFDSSAGSSHDTLGFVTRPHEVLLTQNNQYRLIPVYKLNYDRRRKKYYTGTTRYHSNYDVPTAVQRNNWNGNYMPGFEAAYGHNLVNLSQFDTENKTERTFFDASVLINTIYYPAFSSDTLNGEMIVRDYYMVSVYDEDTNGDGYLNRKDLRRFYYFNRETGEKVNMLPLDHSVMSSEYDVANDYMYIFTRQDNNANGKMEEDEPIEVWWIDLKNPENRGVAYKD